MEKPLLKYDVKPTAKNRERYKGFGLSVRIASTRVHRLSVSGKTLKKSY